MVGAVGRNTHRVTRGDGMAISVVDVAEYILKKLGEIPALKLQKLVYYCQAWSLVWDEKPLFPQSIEAWANGPVSPYLYTYHRLQYSVSTVRGDPEKLVAEQKETIDAVLKTYGDKPSQWLSDLTHSEKPWQDARKGIADGERGNNEITHVSMAEYYSSL